jgi:hypothetical protein
VGSLGAACKPGFVPTSSCPGAGEDHSSRPAIADRLEHSNPDTASGFASRRSSGPLSTMSLFKLAPGGACRAAGHPAVARGLLPHDFNLTCTGTQRVPAIGGVFSAALSLGLPRVGVTDLPVLWSPDFPPVNGICSPAIFQPPPAGTRIVSRVVGWANGRFGACFSIPGLCLPGDLFEFLVAIQLSIH